jgi:riboflavin synthase
VFTGIIEELGTIRTTDRSALEIAASTVLDDVTIGASIAVNGCCLTVVDHRDGSWTTELSAETIARTTLGDLAVGDRVNLERPLALGSRLGGHVVLGHVDGVGEVCAPAPHLSVRIPAELA